VTVDRNRRLLSSALALAALYPTEFARAASRPRTPRDYLGPRFDPTSRRRDGVRPIRRGADLISRFRYWNETAINTSGLDHTPVAAGESRTFGEQLGPTRSSRAMAIVHIAMFEAMNAIAGAGRSHAGVARASAGASMDAAMAQAAHDALAALYPSQKQTFDTFLAEDLNQVANADAKAAGINVGRQAAAAILTRRTNDGSQLLEPRIGSDFITGNQPGNWRQDPISQSPIALGANWSKIQPFVLRSSAQFRPPPPPALTSSRYADAYAEVKQLGGDGLVTPTQRTAEQTQIGIYWAYDGTPSLCAPPRLYNQIAMHVALQRNSSPLRLARLLALVNIAMADSGIAAWEAKYHYQFWRPVTGIRESDPGTGPSGAGDGNSATVGDPTYSPLGAPASNLNGPNFTPPFPSYPSGHAVFGGALFQTLRNFYGTDNIPFSFVSDELNGVTVDNQGRVRPLVPRSFASLSQAEEENGQSRVYLGIHWRFDKTAGIAQGRQVANHVFRNVYVTER
jgi:PAP2 superfamily